MTILPRKLIIYCIILTIANPLLVFSETTLSNNQASRLEAKLRHVFHLQKKNVDNSLLLIERDIEKFLFGPGTSDKLLRYFNKWVKPGKHGQEKLWDEFKEEVLNKDDFLRFAEGLIEIHFRVFEKIRRETNREFVAIDLEGIPSIEYTEVKKQLNEAISQIWDMNEKDLYNIISKSSTEVKDITKLKQMDLYVTGLVVAMEAGVLALAGSGVCPPCLPVLTAAAIVVTVGWFIYHGIINERNVENEMITAQQKFMKNMRKQLKIISEKTKEEFRASSDKTYQNLIDVISTMINKYYPQIKKENLV